MVVRAKKDEVVEVVSLLVSHVRIEPRAALASSSDVTDPSLDGLPVRVDEALLAGRLSFDSKGAHVHRESKKPLQRRLRIPAHRRMVERRDSVRFLRRTPLLSVPARLSKGDAASFTPDIAHSTDL
jgi:hypothetical protein